MQLSQLGPYRIGEQLGRGGMGTVYSAIDIESGQTAAVKVLSASLGREEGFRERFEAEIESLRKLKHPNIVRLLGYGEHEGHLFYAMELVEGGSLEEELARRRRFDWTEAIDLCVQVCHALRHAHDRGVIHRDIKPANLLFSKDGVVKLSDFGIAKLFGASGLTSDGGVLGTAEYMAPEQADGRPVTSRCDLYSLGCVLYALVAGRPPFAANNLLEMLQLQRFAPPEPIRRYVTDVPSELEHVIASLLEKDPEKRVPNAQVLARRLEVVRQGYRLRPTLSAGSEGMSASAAAETPAAPTSSESGSRDGAMGNGAAGGGAAGSPSQMAATAPGTFSAESAGLPASDYSLAPSISQKPVTHEAPAVEPVRRGRTPSAATHVDGTSARDSKTPTQRGSRFTTVDDEEHRKFEPADDETPPWVSVHTWILAAMTVAMGLLVWWLLQPPSADQLFERIAAAGAKDELDSLTQLEEDITRFRNLYSADSRMTKVEEYQEKLDLDRLRRRFDQQRRAKVDAAASPVERAYSEAIKYMDLDPALGAARLEALIALYDDEQENSDIVKQCIQLARLQLANYRDQVNQFAEDDRDLLIRQLARAGELADANPQLARLRYESIIVLYADKPWATSLVADAQAAIANLPRLTVANDDRPIVAPSN